MGKKGVRWRSLLPGLLGLAVAGGAWLEARSLPYQDVSAGLGPALFPHLLIGLLCLLGGGLVAHGLMAPGATHRTDGPPAPDTHADGDGRSDWHRRPVWLRPLALFGLLVLLGASIERVPALLSIFAFLTLAMAALGERWDRSLLYGALASAAVYLLFGTVFGLTIFLP